MRIVSWNMGANSVAASVRERGWRYLFEEDGGLEADIALVQEAILPADIGEERVVFERAWPSRRWGTAVVVRPGLRAVPIPYQQADGGRAVIARVSGGGSAWVAASIHARLVDGVVIPALKRTIDKLFETALPAAGRWTLGGDLNTCRDAERLWPGYGHGAFFDDLDSRHVAVNVYWSVHQREEPTYEHPKTKARTQADHIFVDPTTAGAVLAASVVDHCGLSDHKPLVVEVDPAD